MNASYFRPSYNTQADPHKESRVYQTPAYNTGSNKPTNEHALPIKFAYNI